ncbi:MAG TPA: hypothetical protein VGI33_15050 [Paenibacillus sp.]|jgi:methylated-DNA-[protein]-cysteine S-methyltransferase
MYKSTVTEIFWTTFVHSVLNDRLLHVAASDRGLCLISFPDDLHMNMKQWVGRKFPNAVLIEDKERLSPYLEQLQAYCERRSMSFELPLDLKGTIFQVSVWQALMTIPFRLSFLATALSERTAH